MALKRNLEISNRFPPTVDPLEDIGHTIPMPICKCTPIFQINGGTWGFTKFFSALDHLGNIRHLRTKNTFTSAKCNRKQRIESSRAICKHNGSKYNANKRGESNPGAHTKEQECFRIVSYLESRVVRSLYDILTPSKTVLPKHTWDETAKRTSRGIRSKAVSKIELDHGYTVIRNSTFATKKYTTCYMSICLDWTTSDPTRLVITYDVWYSALNTGG